MAEPYCGVVVNLYVFGRYLSISTPNWTHDAPHRPSWLPKWQYSSIDDLPCEHSKMFMLDWFFHFCMIWGGPSKRLLEMRDPPPDDPDDDDDYDDDFAEEFSSDEKLLIRELEDRRIKDE